MPGQILPITYMGDNKLHNRFTTQPMAFHCEGVNCQYCHEEGAPSVAEKPAAAVTVVEPKVAEPVKASSVTAKEEVE